MPSVGLQVEVVLIEEPITVIKEQSYRFCNVRTFYLVIFGAAALELIQQQLDVCSGQSKFFVVVLKIYLIFSSHIGDASDIKVFGEFCIFLARFDILFLTTLLIISRLLL